MPSKKFTRFFLFSISVLPSIMPTIEAPEAVSVKRSRQAGHTISEQFPP